MNKVYSEVRDRVGQVLHDHITENIGAERLLPSIDWHDGREYDIMADKVLEALWGPGNVPKVCAQFSTGTDRGLTGYQPVDVLKVEPNDDGTLTVTIDYWPGNREQELAASLKRMCDMHDAMFKQTNVGASFFGGETLQEMNEAPMEARCLLEPK